MMTDDELAEIDDRDRTLERAHREPFWPKFWPLAGAPGQSGPPPFHWRETADQIAAATEHGYRLVATPHLTRIHFADQAGRPLCGVRRYLPPPWMPRVARLGGLDVLLCCTNCGYIISSRHTRWDEAAFTWVQDF